MKKATQLKTGWGDSVENYITVFWPKSDHIDPSDSVSRLQGGRDRNIMESLGKSYVAD